MFTLLGHKDHYKKRNHDKNDGTTGRKIEVKRKQNTQENRKKRNNFCIEYGFQKAFPELESGDNGNYYKCRDEEYPHNRERE